MYFVSHHIGVIDGNLLVGDEGDAVEFLGKGEDALFHAFEFEVGFYLLVADGIAVVLVLLADVAPVPRHEFESGPVKAACDGIALEFGNLFERPSLRGGQQFVDEGIHRRLVAGHLLFQHVGGVVRIAEESGQFEAQFGDAFGNVAVVIFADAAGVVRSPELLLQFPVAGVGHEGTVARHLQRYGPSLLAACGRFVGHAFPDEIGQFGYFGGVCCRDVERKGVGSSQYVLFEFQ